MVGSAMSGHSGDNFTIDLEEATAIVRVFRRPELGPSDVVASAKRLAARCAELTLAANVSGLVLDLRRATGAVAPDVEAEYGRVLRAFESTAQPIAVLVSDAVQAMQAKRLVSADAPRHGGVFTARDQARRFVGAVDREASTRFDLIGAFTAEKTGSRG